MRIDNKYPLKVLALTLCTMSLIACGGGGGSNNSLLPSDSNSQASANSAQASRSITVSPPRTYSAIVEWDIPSTRENGEALDLSEIGGYELIYRKMDEALKPAIVITDQTRDSYEITDLPAGRYEVRIAAFDTDGLYSDFSEPAFADIGR